MKYLMLIFLLTGCGSEPQTTHPLVVDYVGIMCEHSGIRLHTCNCILKDIERNKTEEEITPLVERALKNKLTSKERSYLLGTVNRCQLISSIDSQRLLWIEDEESL